MGHEHEGLLSCSVDKKADIVLYYKPNITIALIEAKDDKDTNGSWAPEPQNES
jgi:type I site-specific restriction endonuclease